jgi:hypothetical protein
MRSIRRFGLLCALALLAQPVASAAQSLRSVPLDHWSYAIADEILLRHPEWGEGIHLAARPWREADFTTLLERAREDSLGEDDPSQAFVQLLADAFRPDSGLTVERGVTMHNEVSAIYQGYAAKRDASFEPPFLPPRFGSDSTDGDDDPPGPTGAPAHRVMAQHDFAVQYLDAFVLGWRYVLDSHVKSDPTRFRQLEARKDEDFGFAILDAYGTVHYGPLYLTIGRNEQSFGPGRATAIFLSDSIPPLDHARFELDTRRFHFTGLIARLSSDLQNREIDEEGNTIPGSAPPDSGAQEVDRLLYLHRADWQPTTMIQLAVTEAAIVTGLDRGLEFRYANLLVPFFVTQEDEDEPEGRNVNIALDLEGVLSLPQGLRLYGAVMVEEFFIDEAEREGIGNQLAWRLGGTWGGAVGPNPVTVGAEYTRLDVFTYLHRGLNTSWSTYQVPLGSSLGPDAEQSAAWISWFPRPHARVTLDALARRGGEQSITSLDDAVGAGNPDFPSGIVQRELRGGVEGWLLLPRWGVEALIRASVRDVRNLGNEENDDERFWHLNVGLRWGWQFR